MKSNGASLSINQTSAVNCAMIGPNFSTDASVAALAQPEGSPLAFHVQSRGFLRGDAMSVTQPQR